MIIALDTNILIADYLIKSNLFDILLDYSQKTQSRIVLPKVVCEELKARYEIELKTRFSTAKKHIRKTNTMLVDTVLEVEEIGITEQVDLHIEYVKKKLRIKPDDMPDYTESQLRDAMERAIKRKPPCTERGEEIRDTVLWLSVLDISEKDSKEPVIFISNNTKQFATTEKDLHPALSDEAKKRGIEVNYYPTLSEFAREQAVKIEYITEQWIATQISIDEILEKIEDNIVSSAEYRLDGEMDEGQSSTGYYGVVGASSENIEEFFVNEMSDGSHKIRIRFYAEIEVECEIEQEKRRDNSSEGYSVLGGYISMSDTESKFKYVYPELYITVEATVVDKKISEWEVSDVED